VGYTNAGKSTLINALTDAKVYVADQLFATLDPTTRRLTLPGGKVVLISDTVGFIQKLPATLIAAFRATLEEVSEADMIIHVVDAAHPHAAAQIETVEDTLAEIDVPRLPRILALNKIDLLPEGVPPLRGTDRYAAIVPISAQTGEGIPRLIGEIERVLRESMLEIKLFVPYQRSDLLALIREQGMLDQAQPTPEGTHVRAHVPPRLAALLAEDRI
jgi:GTP-binding protein HflX